MIQFTYFLLHCNVISDKTIQYISDIKRILLHGTVDSKTWESTIGRLNCAAHMIPQTHYFINRLRDLFHQTTHQGPQRPKRACCNNLHLWLTTLETVSTKGIDIDNITLQQNIPSPPRKPIPQNIESWLKTKNTAEGGREAYFPFLIPRNKKSKEAQLSIPIRSSWQH